jgi:hypothetical protein
MSLPAPEQQEQTLPPPEQLQPMELGAVGAAAWVGQAFHAGQEAHTQPLRLHPPQLEEHRQKTAAVSAKRPRLRLKTKLKKPETPLDPQGKGGAGISVPAAEDTRSPSL